ncbi:uncharacterized protein Hap1MRO34_023442 [Clarias gariepinus]
MVQYVALPVCLCVMGLLSETLYSLTLVAEIGDKVTIWCQHDLTVTGYVSWFKHISDSVPLPMGCKQFFTSAPSETCYFFTESKRIMMSVYRKNTSLTITAVNVSDTGLYYCGYMEQNRITYSDSVYLRVKGQNKTVSKITERAEGSDCPAVFFMLILVFAAATVILLSVLIIVLKDGKTHIGAEAEDNKFSKKKKRMSCDESEYTSVVYSTFQTESNEPAAATGPAVSQPLTSASPESAPALPHEEEEHIMMGNITTWFRNSTMQDRRVLQRVV